MTSVHSFFTVAIASRINVAWNRRSFIHTSRFTEGMRLWETDLQSLLNHAWLSIPEVRWTEQHSEFVLLSSQVHTWEYLVLPGFWGLLEEFLSHRYAVPRDETTCTCFHLQRNQAKSFLEIFSSERIRAQICDTTQNSAFPCNVNTIECVFASGVGAFLQSSSRIVSFFSEECRSIVWILWKMMTISASSSDSSGWNSSLSPWDSPLRFSLFTVDSLLRVGSWNS